MGADPPKGELHDQYNHSGASRRLVVLNHGRGRGSCIHGTFHAPIDGMMSLLNPSHVACQSYGDKASP
jgi:hypothetical protein